MSFLDRVSRWSATKPVWVQVVAFPVVFLVVAIYLTIAAPIKIVWFFAWWGHHVIFEKQHWARSPEAKLTLDDVHQRAVALDVWLNQNELPVNDSSGRQLVKDLLRLTVAPPSVADVKTYSRRVNQEFGKCVGGPYQEFKVLTRRLIELANAGLA